MIKEYWDAAVIILLVEFGDAVVIVPYDFFDVPNDDASSINTIHNNNFTIISATLHVLLLSRLCFLCDCRKLSSHGLCFGIGEKEKFFFFSFLIA
jgi:hypothetical protein